MSSVLISSDEYDHFCAMQWKPIETAPKAGTDILVFDGKQIWLVDTEYEMYPKDNGCGCCSNSIHNEATHWMPLPEPPK